MSVDSTATCTHCGTSTAGIDMQAVWKITDKFSRHIEIADRVKKGQKLWLIARKYGMSIEEALAALKEFDTR
jgi:LysM repeat protein